MEVYTPTVNISFDTGTNFNQDGSVLIPDSGLEKNGYIESFKSILNNELMLDIYIRSFLKTLAITFISSLISSLLARKLI